MVSYSSSFIISTMIQRFAERLRNAIKLRRSIAYPPIFLIAMDQGDTLSRVTNDGI